VKEVAGPTLNVSSARTLGGLLLAATFGVLAVWLGLRLARTAIIDIGPTDAEYVSGFREIERDGSDYFRWTQAPASTVTFPLRDCDESRFRARIRRHSTVPVQLSISVSGREIGNLPVVADPDQPYRILDIPFPKVPCGSNTQVVLESIGADTRGLGVTVDWLELSSATGFRPTVRLLAAAGVCSVLSCLLFTLLRAPAHWSLGSAAISASAIGVGFAANPVASARIVIGTAISLTVLVPILAICLRPKNGGSEDDRSWARIVGGVSLATLGTRVLFLHPAAFYPDYRVHGLVEETLERMGLGRFLSSLFEIQYARSLGLQQVGDHWYPFPYPPGSYLLIRALGGLFHLTPLDACLVAAVIAASLVPLLTAIIGRRFVSAGEALVAAGIVAFHPLLVRRLALGYVPGVIGQTLDLVAILVLLRVLAPSQRQIATMTTAFTILLTTAFLVYTQSIANFGILVAGLIAGMVGQRRASFAPTTRVAVSALLALVLACGLFYARYLPVLERAQRGESQPEEAVLDRLEATRQSAASDDQSGHDSEDVNGPFAGPGINPFRGIGRLASRLWRFWGPFSLLLVPGTFLLRKRVLEGRPLLLPWLAVSLVISLLAAGLPSPNGFQHLKDLEFVTPLLAFALAAVLCEARQASRNLASGLSVAWLAYALSQFRAEWLDRLLPLSGR